MMRIAVAGGGVGLGYLIAEQLANADTVYNVIVLSRYPRQLSNPEIQVIVVDYNDAGTLAFALHGVDLVISTINGDEQLALINAAGHSKVRRFVPSEFEGAIEKRPSSNDPLDHGSSEARALLKRWKDSPAKMKYTIFSCGIFMERFHPNGLHSFGIGQSSGVAEPGDYILDINKYTAEYVEQNSGGHAVRVCMTSVHDVARFIVAAIDLGIRDWGREYTMRGDRLSLQDIVGACSFVLGAPFSHQRQQAEALPGFINYYAANGVYERAAYYQRLDATVNGRYDFRSRTLNDAVADTVQPLRFSQWLANVYAR